MFTEYNDFTSQPDLEQHDFFQTGVRGTNYQEYMGYLSCADNGQGGDITRNGAPLLTYEQWLAA